MHIPDFKLERYFARYEFVVDYLLSSSDPETKLLSELLALADDECRNLWGNLSLGYTETTGHPLLKAEIAKQYESVTPEQVLTFAGAQEGIFVAANCILTPNDHAIVTWPGYQSLYAVGQSIGAEVTLLELEHKNSRFRIDLEKLRAAVQPNTKLITINFPHNPTGALPDSDTFKAIVDIARAADAYLFSDEVYRGLEYDKADRLPAAVDCYEKALSLGVLSKVYGLAGLRVGWLATKDEEVYKKMHSFKDYTTICSSAPSEILALIALRAHDKLVSDTQAIVSANLTLLEKFFEKWGEVFEWRAPQVGCIAFPRLRADINIDAVSADLAETAGIMLLPGTVYDYPGNFFRIGFGRKNFPEALAKFDSYLEQKLKG